MGDLSEHFSAREFACPCCGDTGNIHPALIVGLEKLRALYYPNGLVIISGYRCILHNKVAGGAPKSQHIYSCAADIEPVVTLENATAMNAFSGIGWSRVGRKKIVSHVDVRHMSINNTTRSTIMRPATWEYVNGVPR